MVRKSEITQNIVCLLASMYWSTHWVNTTILTQFI